MKIRSPASLDVAAQRGELAVAQRPLGRRVLVDGGVAQGLRGAVDGGALGAGQGGRGQRRDERHERDEHATKHRLPPRSRP